MLSLFAPHTISVLFICKKEVFQMIIIVDNFTSLVKQNELSLTDVSILGLQRGGLAGAVPRVAI
jgi:hypothetical protein